MNKHGASVSDALWLYRVSQRWWGGWGWGGGGVEVEWKAAPIPMGDGFRGCGLQQQGGVE